ncbi:MAG: hypothetical protein ABSA09_01970 [Desulfobaccales bacterium]|jgi:hypothetical protein
MKKDHYPKKISQYDKFQALRRKPSYRADYRDFLFWCKENGIDETDYLDHPEAAKQAEELCKKYSITYLFNPSRDFPKNWGDKFYNDEKETVAVLYPTEYRDLTEDELKRGVRPQFGPIPVFKNGDELIIKIDLKADKELIVKQFIMRLNYYHYFIPRSTSRMTPDRNIDKWEVFDTYNKLKSFEKTARKIKDRASAYAKFLNRFGNTVEAPKRLNISTIRKAYYRAIELVYGEKYDPEKHNPNKLPVKLRRCCDKCPEQSDCNALCPEAWEFYIQDEKYQREIPMSEQEIDIISSPQSHRKAPKPPAE